MGGADSVYPPLRCGSRRVSCYNPEWAEIGQDGAGDDGRKAGDVSEREIEKKCSVASAATCGTLARGWQIFLEATMHATPRCWATRVRVVSDCTGALRSVMRCTRTNVSCEWVFCLHQVAVRASCLPCSVPTTMLSLPTASDSHISSETSCSSLARGIELLLTARWSHLHLHVLAFFGTGANPSSKMLCLVRTPATVPYTSTAKEKRISDSESSGTVSPATPPMCAASLAPTVVHSAQAPWTRSRTVACLSRPCPLVSSASPQSPLLVTQVHRLLQAWFTSFSVTAAASVAPDSSSRSVSITTMSSASYKNVSSQTLGDMTYLFCRFLWRSSRSRRRDTNFATPQVCRIGEFWARNLWEVQIPCIRHFVVGLAGFHAIIQNEPR